MGCNYQPSNPSLTQRKMSPLWIAVELLDGFRFLRGSHTLATRLIVPLQTQLVIERLRMFNSLIVFVNEFH